MSCKKKGYTRVPSLILVSFFYSGSVPFVPPGVTVDEKTVFTSDGGLKLERVPEYVAIIGSGYIGLEFSDVYTALGSEVNCYDNMYHNLRDGSPGLAFS